MNIKNVTLIIMILSVANLISSEFTGTISIACDYSYTCSNNPIHYRTCFCSLEEPYFNYMEFFQTNAEPDLLCDLSKVPNSKSDPLHLKNLEFAEMIQVQIILDTMNPNLFENNQLECYLPLKVFKNENKSFKQKNEKVQILIRLKNSKGQNIKCNFDLTLDETFDDMNDLYREYNQSCGFLGRFYRRCFNRKTK